MGRRTAEERKALEFLLETAHSWKAGLAKRGMRIAAELERVDDEIKEIQAKLDE